MSDVLCNHRRRDPRLRRRSLEIRAWALAQGRGIDPDALTVVLRVIDDDVHDGCLPPTVWTTERVLEFVWARAWTWCEIEGLSLPSAAPDALLAYLDHLYSTGELDATSDPIDDLRAQLGSTARVECEVADGPLATVAALPTDGRSKPGRRLPVPT